ncbi:MAG: NACHT domain-containing protein, partial [Candidatus Odinarchaeota archaeon]
PEYLDPSREKIAKYLSTIKLKLVGENSLLLKDSSKPRTLDGVWVTPESHIVEYHFITKSLSNKNDNLISSITHSAFIEPERFTDEDFLYKTIPQNLRPILGEESQFSMDYSEFSFSEIQEIIKKTDRISLIFEGAAGIGKSTILKMLLAVLTANGGEFGYLPVYIQMRDFSESDLEFSEYLNNHLENLGITAEVLEDYLSTEKIIIGLDGLDEILNANKRESVIIKVITFLKEHQLIKILLTTRERGLLTEVPLVNSAISYIAIKIDSFDDKKIFKFIENWCESPEEAKARFDKLSDDDKILEIASRPLVLTLLMILLDQNKPLPRRRALVYQECINMFLDWDRLKGMVATFDVDIKRRVLTGLAYHLHQLGTNSFSEDDLQKRVVDVLKTTGNVNKNDITLLTAEIRRAEIIIPFPPKGLKFLFRSFYEYLVAKYILDNDKFGELLPRYYDRRVKEIFLLYAGLNESEINPLLALFEENDDVFLRKRGLLMDLSKEISLSAEIEEKISKLCEEAALWNFLSYGYSNIVYASPYRKFREKIASNRELLAFLVELTLNTRIKSYPQSKEEANGRIWIIEKIILESENLKHLAKLLGQIILFSPRTLIASKIGFQIDLKKFRQCKLHNDPKFAFLISKTLDLVRAEEIDIDSLLESAIEIAKGENFYLLDIMEFIVKQVVAYTRLEKKLWILEGVFNSRNSEDVRLWISIYERGFFIPLYQTLLNLSSSSLLHYIEEFFDESSIEEWDSFCTGLIDLIKKKRSIKALEVLDTVILTANQYGEVTEDSELSSDIPIKMKTINMLAERLVTDYLASNRELDYIFHNIISGNTSFLKSFEYSSGLASNNPFIKLRKEIVEKARNQINRMPDENIVNCYSILSEFEEGRTRIRNLLRTDSARNLGIEKVDSLLSVVALDMDDFPLFTNELPINPFLNEHQRKFIEKLCKNDPVTWKAWLTDIDIVKNL